MNTGNPFEITDEDNQYQVNMLCESNSCLRSGSNRTDDVRTCGRTVCFNNRKSLTVDDTQKRATAALIITQFSCNCLTEEVCGSCGQARYNVVINSQTAPSTQTTRATLSLFSVFNVLKVSDIITIVQPPEHTLPVEVSTCTDSF